MKHSSPIQIHKTNLFAEFISMYRSVVEKIFILRSTHNSNSHNESNDSIYLVGDWVFNDIQNIDSADKFPISF